MKNAAAIVLILVMTRVIAQEDQVWRFGIQFGSVSNHSRFQSGMTNAHARFHHNEWSSGAIGFNARFDLDRYWMATAGFGVHTIGFSYALAENYSLLRKERQFTGVRSEVAVLEMPAMIFYKFNPNCRNARWLVGAGISQDLIGGQQSAQEAFQESDGSAGANYISSTSTTKGGIFWNFRWSVAREKKFRNNSILNASVLFNYGFNRVATSTVDYTIDGQTYTHTFTNSGHFVGLRLTYHFRPFINPWQVKRKAASKSSLNK